MEFQENDNHFVVSQELLIVMQYLIEYYSDDLKDLIKKALSRKIHNNEPFDAQEAQETILDFLTLLELLAYENNQEFKVNQQLQKQLMPSIDHIDLRSFDSSIVDASIEQTTQEIEQHPQKNPQEILFKEILKQWKPHKKTNSH